MEGKVNSLEHLIGLERSIVEELKKVDMGKAVIQNARERVKLVEAQATIEKAITKNFKIFIFVFLEIFFISNNFQSLATTLAITKTFNSFTRIRGISNRISNGSLPSLIVMQKNVLATIIRVG